jgi:hypothetical protein
MAWRIGIIEKYGVDRKDTSTPNHWVVAFSMAGGQIFLLASSTDMWLMFRLTA